MSERVTHLRSEQRKTTKYYPLALSLYGAINVYSTTIINLHLTIYYSKTIYKTVNNCIIHSFSHSWLAQGHTYSTPSLGSFPRHFSADCSVCSKNYVSTRRFTCRECPDRTLEIAIVVIVALLASSVSLGVVSYLVSTEVVGAGQGIVARLKERIPKESIKIIVVMWQILTQVRMG